MNDYQQNSIEPLSENVDDCFFNLSHQEIVYENVTSENSERFDDGILFSDSEKQNNDELQSSEDHHLNISPNEKVCEPSVSPITACDSGVSVSSTDNSSTSSGMFSFLLRVIGTVLQFSIMSEHYCLEHVAPLE